MITLARGLVYFGDIITTCLFARAILSWFVRGGNGTLGTIYEYLVKFTEPIVSPCRKLLNKYLNTGMMDFSIFAAMILVELVVRVLVRVLLVLA